MSIYSHVHTRPASKKSLSDKNVLKKTSKKKHALVLVSIFCIDAVVRERKSIVQHQALPTGRLCFLPLFFTINQLFFVLLSFHT